MSCRTSMRALSSSSTVPASSGAFATATSSSDLRTIALSAIAYVAIYVSSLPASAPSDVSAVNTAGRHAVGSQRHGPESYQGSEGHARHATAATNEHGAERPSRRPGDGGPHAHRSP